MPPKSGTIPFAQFKSWDTTAKARKILAKTIGSANAKEQLPECMADWTENNHKVITQMTKFANNGYPEHVVKPEQTAELLKMIQNFPATVETMPVSQQFTCPLLWKLWDGVDNAVVDEPVAAGTDVVETNTADPVVLAPEIIPVLEFGLTTKQIRAQERAAAAMIAANVLGPAISTNVPVPVMSTNVPVPDNNPSSPKRRRQSTRNLEVNEFQVGRKVKIQAWRFGSKWAKREFGNLYKTKIMLGTIVSSAGRSKWNVCWEYDGDTTMRPQKELRVAETY